MLQQLLDIDYIYIYSIYSYMNCDLFVHIYVYVYLGPFRQQSSNWLRTLAKKLHFKSRDWIPLGLLLRSRVIRSARKLCNYITLR